MSAPTPWTAERLTALAATIGIGSLVCRAAEDGPNAQTLRDCHDALRAFAASLRAQDNPLGLSAETQQKLLEESHGSVADGLRAKEKAGVEVVATADHPSFLKCAACKRLVHPTLREQGRDGVMWETCPSCGAYGDKLRTPAAGPELAETLTDSLLAEVYLALNYRWVSGAYETAQIDKARALIVKSLVPWLAVRDAAKDATIADLEARLRQ